MLSFQSAITLLLKEMAWKHDSDPGHTSLKKQLEKNLKITFVSLSKRGNEREKEVKQKGNSYEHNLR